MNRRTFLGTMTAASVLANRAAWAASGHKVGPIGLQLYTVRTLLDKDFEGTLAQVASIGYRNVELAGFKLDNGKVLYFGRTPAELKSILDKHGLVPYSTHVSYKSLAAENFSAVLDASKVLGHRCIVNSSVDEEVRKQPDGWKHVAETFNRAGQACKDAGFQFAYHNHWMEFIPADGKLPYDGLLHDTDASLVKYEMDLCWIISAGGDPVKYFGQYPGRFPLVHVKDLKTIPPAGADTAKDFGDTVAMTEVGSGVIDWKRIFKHAAQAGIKLYIVEHDHPKEPVESVRASYEYLDKLRVS